MPIFKNFEPLAGWTLAATTAAAKAVTTRRRRTRLGSDGLAAEGDEHAPEPVFQLDLRLPPEQLPRTGDVRLSHLRVVDGERLEHDLALRAGQPPNRLGKLEQRHLARVADVDGQVLVA